MNKEKIERIEFSNRDRLKMRIPLVSSRARISMPGMGMGVPRMANRLRVVWENLFYLKLNIRIRLFEPQRRPHIDRFNSLRSIEVYINEGRKSFIDFFSGSIKMMPLYISTVLSGFFLIHNKTVVQKDKVRWKSNAPVTIYLEPRCLTTRKRRWQLGNGEYHDH